ncbi:MAG: YihA family ribosome biogenesis GTP-binding protein [Proteobacteria bacterium]|nr:MAG: YihA family ribosome biogenesis GTP-binding protein [Pseudomonadota bacterium]
MSNPPRLPGLDLSKAEFVKEAHILSQMPSDVGAEIAFAGRSNVGKSSVINALCNRRKLARTSRTPGRTQRFVVYDFAPGRRFVDLPGFGYAKVSKSKRHHWVHEIPRYLETRRSLIGLILVADSRHPLKDQELEILSWCADADLCALLLLNKCDKLNQQQSAAALREARRMFDLARLSITVALFSATARRGIDQTLGVVAGWFERDLGELQNKKDPGR